MKNHIFANRVSLQKLFCLNLTNAREFVAKLTTASKLHRTDYVSVFIGQLQGILHMSSCDGTVGTEKSHFCLPSFSAKFTLLECHQCYGVCDQTDYIASKVHSTDYVAVFIGQLQGILHMSSCGGTVGREKSHFCLPSFSAKITLLKFHQSKGM